MFQHIQVLHSIAWKLTLSVTYLVARDLFILHDKKKTKQNKTKQTNKTKQNRFLLRVKANSETQNNSLKMATQIGASYHGQSAAEMT